jgi:hypothetical protein
MLPSVMVALASVPGSELIVCNFGGDPQVVRELVPRAGTTRLIHVHNQEFFNKSRAANLAASHATGELLFFCDCDIILPKEILLELRDRVSGSPDAFATLQGVRESKVNARGAGHVACFGYELNIRTVDGRRVQIVDNEEDALDGTRQAPGLLFVKRRHFLSVDGYNGHLHGWGWEDQDMICRLTLGGGLSRINHGIAVHLSHDEDSRIRHYPAVRDRWESRDRMFRQALDNYNRAEFRGTYAYDRTLDVEEDR